MNKVHPKGFKNLPQRRCRTVNQWGISVFVWFVNDIKNEVVVDLVFRQF
jgi:hypothetical protein